MSEPIIYVDRSEIREGNLEELRRAIRELAALVEANEPQLVAYNAYITEDGSQISVVHVHRDAASLELHLRVASPSFPRFAKFVRLLAIDVYGRPSEEVVEQLRQKARLLGSGSVRVHGLEAGFIRLEGLPSEAPSEAENEAALRRGPPLLSR